MNYKNYHIKSNGKFYQSFKEKPEEKAVETKDKEGITRFHVEHNEVVGKLYSVEKQTVDFGHGDVEQIRISLNEGETAHVISVPIMDNRGQVSDWAREVAKYLPNLNVGDEIGLALNQKKTRQGKDGKDYLYKNMYINRKGPDSGDKVEWAFNPVADVPKIVQMTVKDKVTKKDRVEYDASDRDSWYYDIITEHTERLKHGSAASVKVEEGQQTDADIPDDGMPF